MSLEKDISQTVFRTEYQKAILNILYTQNYLVTRMNEVFKPFDITRQQYNVLRILRGQYPDPASINLIRERMLEKMSDTSRIVERLRVKGLITRADGKIDKRAAEVTITDAGLDLLRRMRRPVEELESMLDALSLPEAQQLNHLLDKIRRTSSSENEKPVHHLELAFEPENF